MAQEGMVIVAASDNSGAVYNPKGLNIEAALAWIREHRYLKGFPGGEAIGKEDLLTLDVEVLVPAAVENVITPHNAGQIKAKIICEGANGPTTAGADSILDDKGIFVIPDILANAGGVTVSYFEWVQDRGGYFWDEATVNERLDRILRASFQDVLSLGQRHSVNLRTSAYMLAIERVAAVHRLRGMYA
jgi:glutamate dehydrogenase (NAD(P)+)